MTAAKASPELMPNTATATAMASSKLLLAAVKDSVVVLLVIGADRLAHPEADQEHDHKVDQQRDGDAHHIQRDGDDQVALQAEHDHDGEQQRDQGDRADLGDEFLVIPLLALHAGQHHAGDETGDERNAQVDEHAPGDLADGDLPRCCPAGQTRSAAR